MADFADTRRTATLPTMRIAKGLAAFRIFVGVVWLGNALAKVVNQGSFDLGVVSFGLISRDTARGLLESYTGPESNAIAPLKSVYRDLVLANWDLFQWLLTAAELTIGITLVLGIASRLGPLLALALIFPLWIMVIDNGRYLFEWPLDIVPLAILAVVPAGRVWGQDQKLVARFGDHWPF
jgi:thiosulfate dehydrogenase (quinone) large subunit